MQASGFLSWNYEGLIRFWPEVTTGVRRLSLARDLFAGTPMNATGIRPLLASSSTMTIGNGNGTSITGGASTRAVGTGAAVAGLIFVNAPNGAPFPAA